MKQTKPAPKDYGHSYDEGDALDKLAIGLESKLADAISQKRDVEARMAEDLRQFQGLYDPATEKRLKESSRSKVFVNITRYKTNAGEGQLVDLLFPNDDEKNWGLCPTPSPDMEQKLSDDTPHQVGDIQYQDEQGNVIKNSDIAHREVELAQEAAVKMSNVIADQLTESAYGEVCRRMIHNGATAGTGIIKAPVVEGRTKRGFVGVRDATGARTFKAANKTEFKPCVRSIDPWDFFPDMTVANVEDCEFTFERSYLNRTQVRHLVSRKGFKPDRVRRLLRMRGRDTQHPSTYVDDIRRVAGLAEHLNDDRYELWEYNGPIDGEVLVQLGVLDLDPEDPLNEFTATVFYCGGIVLGAKLHLVEQDQCHPYHVWCWEKDESSIFGRGVPRLTRHSQSAANTSWRMMLDNASITAGPQIGVKRRGVSPMNGDWELSPFKFWSVDHTVSDIRQAFSKVEFDSHQNELAGIYQLSRQLMDEEAGVPMLQQGEQGQTSSTVGGMSMLMNAANTVRRRQVQDFDDRITSRVITSLYHFNMLYSTDETIKGDYQVEAKGSTALLARETQAQALLNFFNIGANNPHFSHVFDLKGNKLVRAFMRTQQLPKDVSISDEEFQNYVEQQQQNAQEAPDPMLQVEQMRVEQFQQKAEHELKVEQMKIDAAKEAKRVELELKYAQLQADVAKAATEERLELYRLAEQGKLSEQKLIVELRKVTKQLEQKSAIFKTEAEMKRQGYSEFRS